MDASIATKPTTSNSSPEGAAERNVGRIEEIQGVVLDVVFPDKLPEINHAITIARPDAAGEGAGAESGRELLVCEVQQHLGDDRVRVVAMDTTDGLARGAEAIARLGARQARGKRAEGAV